MSEEAKVEDVEINLEAEVTEAVVEVEHSPAESEALKHGWKPQDDWEGNDEDFISAPEFNRRAELFDKIARQGRDLKQIDSKYNPLMQMQGKIAEKTRKDTIAELMEAKTEAYANEDFSRVVELDEQIAVEKFNSTYIPPDAAPAQANPEFVVWANDNPWYESNAEMAELADAFGAAYGNKEVANGRNPQSISMEEVLAHVNKKMQPMLKSTPSRGSKPSAVEGAGKSAGKRGTKKGAFSEGDLSVDQKTIMYDIMKSDSTFTKEMYIDSLVEIGELTK